MSKEEAMSDQRARASKTLKIPSLATDGCREPPEPDREGISGGPESTRRLLAKRAEIDGQLEALDLRIRAAEIYRATREGRFSLPASGRKTRASSTRAPRGSREQLKRQILDLLKQHPEGLVSNQICASLPEGAKQIPNVLSVMKKDGVLDQEARRGPYRIAK
jgi:hypothetical protein